MLNTKQCAAIRLAIEIWEDRDYWDRPPLADSLTPTVDILLDGGYNAADIAENCREYDEQELADKAMLFANHDDDAICDLY